MIAHVAASASLRRTWFIAAQTIEEYSTAATQTELVTSACMLSHECLCLDALYSLQPQGLTSARSRLFFSLLFQVKQLPSPTFRLLVRSSLVTNSSALQTAAQNRHHTQIWYSSATSLSSAGCRSRLPSGDVFKPLQRGHDGAGTNYGPNFALFCPEENTC